MLSLSEYVFNIGDEVITIEGERGHITSICDCKYCKERGFFEPYWIDEDGDPRDISVYEAESGFQSYYRIGQYRFSPFAKDSVQKQIDSVEKWLAQLKNRLNLINVLEEDV